MFRDPYHAHMGAPLENDRQNVVTVTPFRAKNYPATYYTWEWVMLILCGNPQLMSYLLMKLTSFLGATLDYFAPFLHIEKIYFQLRVEHCFNTLAYKIIARSSIALASAIEKRIDCRSPSQLFCIFRVEIAYHFDLLIIFPCA